MSDLSKRIPVYLGPVSAKHGAEVAAAQARRWQPIATGMDALAADKTRIHESIELSPAGKAKALEALMSGDAAALATKLAAIKKALRAEFEALLGDENAAQVGMKKVPEGGYVRDKGAARLERTAENIMLEVELRAQLQDMKRLELANVYLQAVADGSDPLLVSAVENAPSRRFALVDDETLLRAQEIRIEKSPMRDSVGRERDVYDANALLFELAWSELYAAAPSVRDTTPPLPQRKAVTLPWGIKPAAVPLAS